MIMSLNFCELPGSVGAIAGELGRTEDSGTLSLFREVSGLAGGI
jgi:hypothetical protein